jgi:hypothetical protein
MAISDYFSPGLRELVAKSTATKKYIDPVFGSNANNGNAQTTPYQTLDFAFAATTGTATPVMYIISSGTNTLSVYGAGNLGGATALQDNALPRVYVLANLSNNYARLNYTITAGRDRCFTNFSNTGSAVYGGVLYRDITGIANNNYSVSIFNNGTANYRGRSWNTVFTQNLANNYSWSYGTVSAGDSQEPVGAYNACTFYLGGSDLGSFTNAATWVWNSVFNVANPLSASSVAPNTGFSQSINTNTWVTASTSTAGVYSGVYGWTSAISTGIIRSLTSSTMATSSAASAFWGDTLKYTLNTLNVADGTLIPYTISGVTSAQINGASTSGNFTVQFGQAELTVNTVEPTSFTTATLTISTSLYNTTTNFTHPTSSVYANMPPEYNKLISLSTATKIFIDPNIGKDENNGSSPIRAYRSIRRAFELNTGTATPVMYILNSGTYVTTGSAVSGSITCAVALTDQNVVDYTFNAPKVFVCAPGKTNIYWSESNARDIATVNFSNTSSAVYGASFFRDNGGRGSNFNVALFNGTAARFYGNMYNCGITIQANGSYSWQYQNNSNLTGMVVNNTFVLGGSNLGSFNSAADLILHKCQLSSGTPGDSTTLIETDTSVSVTTATNWYAALNQTSGVYGSTYAWPLTDRGPGLYADRTVAYNGETILIELVTTNRANNETLSYTITGVTSNQINNVPLTGVFTVTSNYSSLRLPVTKTTQAVSTVTITVNTSTASVTLPYLISITNTPRKNLQWGQNLRTNAVVNVTTNTSIAYTITNVASNLISNQSLTGTILTGGSHRFNGSSNLTFSPNLDWTLGTGDFTIEAWVKITSGTTGVILDMRTSGVSIHPVLYISGNSLRFFTGGGDRITSPTLTNGIWYHCALVRISGVTKMYLNGNQAGATYTDANNYLPGSVYIGRGYDLSNALTGKISNLRLIKGTGLYTKSLLRFPQLYPSVVSTQPLTLSNGTTLLTCHRSSFSNENILSTATVTISGTVAYDTDSPFSVSQADITFTATSTSSLALTATMFVNFAGTVSTIQIVSSSTGAYQNTAFTTSINTYTYILTTTTDVQTTATEAKFSTLTNVAGFYEYSSTSTSINTYTYILTTTTDVQTTATEARFFTITNVASVYEYSNTTTKFTGIIAAPTYAYSSGEDVKVAAPAVQTWYI